jgi:lysophospholipase L1-like esterase
MKNKKLLWSALICLSILANHSFATNTSTADPSYPSAFDDIDSDPLREQFNKIINDIDNLWAAIGPNFLEANQILGALVSGKATAISVPSCFSPTNALTWRPGLGLGCNDIAIGGGGSLGPAPAFTVIAGPAGGAPAVPTAIQLTGNYLPLPSSNSIGGVQSVAPISHQFVNGISTSGVPLLATPAFSDISGTVGAAQLPTPSASSLGGTESIGVVSHNFMTGISNQGAPTQAQPSFNDVSGNISTSQMASGSGASINTYWRGGSTWAPPPGLDSLLGATSTGATAQYFKRVYNGTTSSYIPQNTYLLNFDPNNLISWRLALAKVRAGIANARALILGDSTVFGTGSNNSNTGNLKALSFPTQLAGFLASLGLNVHTNSVVSDGCSGCESNHANDPRLTMGTGWSQSSVQTAGGGMWENSSGNTSGALSFLPTVNLDTFIVGYQVAPGNGTISVDINGSGTITQSTNGANGIGYLTIVGSLGSSTVNIKYVSGGTVRITMIEAYDSSKKWLDVMNAGWASATSSSLAQSGFPWTPLTAAVSSIHPDLIILKIGINDWLTGVPVVTYIANVQAIVTAAKTAGISIIIICPPPARPGVSYATQQTYVNALYTMAISNNVSFIDDFDRFGANEATYNSFYWDGLHFNGAGDADEASELVGPLLSSYAN